MGHWGGVLQGKLWRERGSCSVANCFMAEPLFWRMRTSERERGCAGMCVCMKVWNRGLL